MLTEQEQKQLDAMRTEEPINEPEEKIDGEIQEEGQTEDEGQKDPLLEKAAPEAKAKDEPKKEDKEHTKVSHAALHEEREKRKAIQKELREMHEKFARVDERLKILHPEKQETGPSQEDDPLGYERFERQRLQKEFEDRNKSVNDKTEKLTREMQALQYKSQIERQEMLFERQNPDYQDALKHLVDFRTNVLEDFDIDESERLHMVQQELANAVNMAMDRGKNPAEVVYKMAQKIGYKKKDTENKFEQIERGVKNASSLGAAGGKAGGVLTAEALAEMSDEEFKKLDFKDFRKVLGG